jgi:hypothetical protein
MVKDLPSVPTIGAIAKTVGASERAIDRTIRALGITPVARAGLARVFSLEAVERIRREIEGSSDAS